MKDLVSLSLDDWFESIEQQEHPDALSALDRNAKWSYWCLAQ